MSNASWGFTKSGRARVFPDGVLPPNWHTDPNMIRDPALRTSEAVTRAYENEMRLDRPVDEPDDAGVMPPKPVAETIAVPLTNFAAFGPTTVERSGFPDEPEQKRRGRPPGSKNKAA